MKWVVDASVVFGWFLPQGVKQGLSNMLEKPYTFLAPDLIFPEVCNGVWRLVQANNLSDQKGREILHLLPNTMDQVTPCAQLVQSAFEISVNLKHPAYDCFYLALAAQEKTQMITVDQRLINRLENSQYSGLAIQPTQMPP